MTPAEPTVTIAEACRRIGVSYTTFCKWASLGLVRMVEKGPPECRIRRVPVVEVERLRSA